MYFYAEIRLLKIAAPVFGNSSQRMPLESCFVDSGENLMDHVPRLTVIRIWERSISLVPTSTHMVSVAVHFKLEFGFLNTDLIQATVNARDFWLP